MTEPASDLFLAHCRELIGKEYVLVEEADVAPYLTDWRGRFTGRARAVLRPANPVQVAGLVDGRLVEIDADAVVQR